MVILRQTSKGQVMRKSIVAVLFFFVVTAFNATAQKSNDLPLKNGNDVAVVQTKSGKVRGYVHNGIYTYKGIPYAQARRFEAPEKPKPWDGIRSSMTYGPVAPLLTPTTQVADESEFLFHHDWGYTNEDCLRINV